MIRATTIAMLIVLGLFPISPLAAEEDFTKLAPEAVVLLDGNGSGSMKIVFHSRCRPRDASALQHIYTHSLRHQQDAVALESFRP